MKWEKVGQIFDFNKSKFKDRFYGFAQSPQAIEFDDFVRVYFTTRKIDNNKYISIPQYVDYTKDFSNTINHSTSNIISNGGIGCFDEHGIFPFSPTKVNDIIFAYTSGWSRRISVDVETSVGIAVSQDNGKTFTRLGDGPILTSSMFEPYLVVDGFVRMFNNIFYMFYIYGEKWIYNNKNNKYERVYKITYATSKDGINWDKSGDKIISNIIDENECQALPTVIEINGIYHMYFCYRGMIDFRNNNDSNAYKIGYAYSKDLKIWIRDDKKGGMFLSEHGWDSKMMCYPNIFKVENNVYLLYNGNEFGKQGFGLAKLVDI